MQTRSRRDFLKTSAILSTAALTATAPFSSPRVHAGSSDMLKLGIIGCGGRGCGAVGNALDADPNVKLTIAADIFPDRAKGNIAGLKERYDDRIAVNDDTFFFGFDAYKNVLESDVDIVLLTTPQHFRPMLIKEAVEAGKHIFAEKPVAVDGVGIRMIQEAGEIARQKGLNLVGGLVNRYNASTREIINRIHDGVIGDVITARGDRMGGELWRRPRAEGQTEMEYQMMNWVNFNWIAGEYVNDVTIHQLDIALWSFGDLTPASAYSISGRLSRRGADSGDMHDAMATVYEFADGRSIYAFSRQIPGCFSRGDTTINGAKGYAILGNMESQSSIFINGEEIKVPRGEVSGFVTEHKVLIDAVRSGGSTYVNNTSYMTNSTGAAILGRLAAYTGQRVTWEEMLALEEPKPSSYDFNATPPTLPDEKGRYQIALPCIGKGYLD